ncbi:ABC-three component system protein [Clostridium sp.]|uniref:ABC-three component system protein n=1 Tax=Clostridium sp. TaxID=1506 RepID=UPI002E7A5884|nr:ABC-three component system protein [Clostridium sp.]MEE0566802.1 ABC-three component system protein [Clostridium sp.]
MSPIQQWSEKCESRITKKERVVLEDKFLEYVKNFDFSIVCDIPPIKLIEQYSQTIYYKFRFGGGIKKREKPEVPKEVSKEEEKFNYMKELFIVYSDELNFNVKSYDELKSNKKYFNHCNRQREDFYIAQLLARVSRDEYLDSQPYDELKNEIYKGVIDCCEEEHSSCFKKVNETLKVARNMNIESMAFGPISPSEKVGICHDLVNNYEISWVGNYEGE